MYIPPSSTARTRQSGTAWSSTEYMYRKRMDDVVTVPFKARVASGELINNNLSSFTYTCTARVSDYVGSWTLYTWS